jgi:putative SOS response-associated peptidase YedK
MCNRYRPASVTRVRDEFGFTLIREREPVSYNTDGIGPLQNGPFIQARGLEIGQWGLIPWFSKTRRPTAKSGQPISTNNCRIESVATAPSFKDPWARGQRCLIPALDFDEPYWGTGRNVWWRFGRRDGQAWSLAGLWAEWADPGGAEIVPSYTMLTQNCDGHSLLSLMHKPDPTLPPDRQDKRTVVPIERQDWQAWLLGSVDEAIALINLPDADLFVHGAADRSLQLPLLGDQQSMF